MAVQKKSGTKDVFVENVKARFFEMAGWGTTKEDLAREIAEVDRKIAEHRQAIAALAATKEGFGDRDKAVVETIIAAKGLFGDDEDKVLAAVKLKYGVKKAKAKAGPVDPALLKKVYAALTSEPETIGVIMSRLPKDTERTAVSKALAKLIADGNAIATGKARSKSYYLPEDEAEDEGEEEEEEEDEEDEEDEDEEVEDESEEE